MKKLLLLLATQIFALVLDYEVYFSPKGGAEQALIKTINSANNSIMIMAYNFTNDKIICALADMNATNKTVKIILDKTNKNNLKLALLTSADICIDRKHRIMHDKIMIIDDEIVVTGSYNFTQNAELHNSENLLIIRDKNLVNDYKKHFAEKWQECK